MKILVEMDGQVDNYQKVKVFALFLIWATMGLYTEIPGPTLIDIKLLFSASYEEVSRSVSGRGAGGFVGALLGGILVDKFDRSLDLLVALSETVASVAVLTIPFSLGINFLWFHYFTMGACSGIIGIAGIRAIITVWGDRTSTMLLLLHVGYGLGALLVPVIVNPFLAVIKHKEDTTGHHHQDRFEVVKDSNVHYAFVLIGISSMVLSLVFYYFQYKEMQNRGYEKVPSDTGTKPKSLSVREMVNPGTYADGSFGFGLYMFIVLFIFYFNMVGGEEVYGNFVRSFAVDAFKFSKTEASYLNMTFWLSLTITRLLMSLASNYVHIKKLFKLQVLFHLFSTTLMNVYASKSASMLWLCTILQGAAISPLYPSGIAYGNTQMDITGVCLMVIVFAGAFGDLTYIWVSGKLYDTIGPSGILYALQFTGVILTICIILFRLVERSEKEKESRTRPNNPFKHICNKCT